MPRIARLDAPCVLHHVMGRGIERRKIFFNDKDRSDFINRLAAGSHRFRKMDTPKSKPGISEAMRLTTYTINIQTSIFRNLVITVVVVSLISLIWAAIQRSWLPLLGVLLLAPICGAFFFYDIHLIDRWQQQILAMWEQENLDLDIFTQAMTTISALPQHTLRGMRGTLPTKDKVSCGGNIPQSFRHAVAMTLKTINGCHKDRTVCVTLAWTLGLASPALAAIQWSWLPLLGFLLVIIIISVGKWLSLSRLGSWSKQILGAKQEQGLDIKKFVEIAGQLEWDPISDKKQEQLLNSLVN